jgi:AcrR family transcriptional regulator
VSNNTREAILEISRDILVRQGPGSLTFDAVAQRLGKSKQAIIYWFPTKQDLLRELVVPWIEAEADQVVQALAGVRGAGEAIARAVRSLVDFHLADLDRFRQVYLAVQLDSRPQLLIPKDALERHVHPTTARMYKALADVIANDAGWSRRKIEPRRAAMTIHMASLGLVLMLGVSAAIEDPLAHRTEDLVETLIALLS